MTDDGRGKMGVPNCGKGVASLVQSSKLAPGALKLAGLVIVVQFGAPAHAQMSENKVQMPQLLFHPPQTAHPYPLK